MSIFFLIIQKRYLVWFWLNFKVILPFFLKHNNQSNLSKYIVTIENKGNSHTICLFCLSLITWLVFVYQAYKALKIWRWLLMLCIPSWVFDIAKMCTFYFSHGLNSMEHTKIFLIRFTNLLYWLQCYVKHLMLFIFSYLKNYFLA